MNDSPLYKRCKIMLDDASKRNKNEFKTKTLFYGVEETAKWILKQDSKCMVCDEEYDFKQDKDNMKCPTFDRINSDIGYTKDNVKIICLKCNHRKQDSDSKILKQLYMYQLKSEIERDLKKYNKETFDVYKSKNHNKKP